MLIFEKNSIVKVSKLNEINTIVQQSEDLKLKEKWNAIFNSDSEDDNNVLNEITTLETTLNLTNYQSNLYNRIQKILERIKKIKEVEEI